MTFAEQYLGTFEVQPWMQLAHETWLAYDKEADAIEKARGYPNSHAIQRLFLYLSVRDAQRGVGCGEWDSTRPNCAIRFKPLESGL